MFELTLELAILKSGSSILYARSLVPDTLLKLLGSQHITCMILVPQALQLFLNGIERQVRLQKKEKQWENMGIRVLQGYGIYEENRFASQKTSSDRPLTPKAES